MIINEKGKKMKNFIFFKKFEFFSRKFKMYFYTISRADGVSTKRHCEGFSPWQSQDLAITTLPLVARDDAASGGELAPKRLNKLKLNKSLALFTIISSIIVLLPVINVYVEIKDYISPTRGGAELGKIKEFPGANGIQSSVAQSLDKYIYLITIIRNVYPENHTRYNLEYHHSVYYIGIIAVLFVFFSFFYVKKSTKVSPLHLSCIISTLILMYMALGDNSILWRFCKYNVPFFFLRHSYPIAHEICLLLIILSAFGFLNVIKSVNLRYLLIFLTVIILVITISKPASYKNKAPFELKPFKYPETRSLYSEFISPVPFDTTPLITKEAAATHPFEDFTFFRKKSFDKLLKENTEYVTGNLFVFSKRLNSSANLDIPIQYLVNNDPNHIRIKTIIPDKGYLIRKENFNKGWIATINNNKVKIIKYNGVFQAVKVNKGLNILDFKFNSIYPTLFWMHVLFVFIGYIALFAYLITDTQKTKLSYIE